MTFQKMSGLTKGIVIDTNDPAGFNRIKIRIPEIHGSVDPKVYSNAPEKVRKASWVDDTSLPWAEVCYPYGSNVPPEQNQVVLVGFFNDDSSQPVVLGWLGYEYTTNEDVLVVKLNGR